MTGDSEDSSLSELPLAIQLQRGLPDPVRKVGYKLLDWVGLRSYRAVLFNSYLRRHGWFQSFESVPVDETGNPIPWLPYSIIELLDRRLDPTFRVCEFGSGNSTLWFADRVSDIVAIENDREWYNRMTDSVPTNVTVCHRSKDNYASEIMEYNTFDFVLIDGIERVECARLALENLTEDGVIVWDDTDRPDYEEGIRLLEEAGFKRLILSGMGPVVPEKQETSIFYRSANNLDL